ncbi:unnamed protein product [Arabis nemorensis]|uniref:Cystatin domain-containing protein n=1 Tax=Arabis nemorensis TaxID=586526 RepID=A0A565ANY4_9BRAS|nr:unnamed protein product [Arabis nemorensis]
MKIIQNMELDEKDDDTSTDSSSSFSYSDFDEDDLRSCNEEFARSGNFDFDFSRVRRTYNFKPVIFNQNCFTYEPDTDEASLERLLKEAIKKCNKEEGTNLELVKVLRANFHPGGGITFYITFEAIDHAHAHDQPKSYQTMIGYLPMDIRVIYVRPKP